MQQQNQQVQKKIWKIAIVIMFLALIEHNLGIASGVYVSKSCWGVHSAEEAYFRQSFTDFFASFKFNIYLGLFAQIVNLFCTFAWNFIDVYLIIVSVLLTEKFACINRRLENNLSVHSPKFWNEIWSGYKICVELVDRTNQLNGGTILISFFSNLYFICVQLLGCFKSESSILDGLYLWFSLIFLIARTLALCLFASEINDESLKPLQTLRSIHSDYFDITMNRFTEQLMNGKVALTGLNFFYLTRKLILSISGTVVTYVLVMVQFNEAEEKESDNNPCT
ncbi:gustatory receptor for sugar taste 64f-like [Chironomus tepperi]|uniref:gustatory receptor for sugar taste 64f-like n=1 Tax=Chironomus tepperi TaxID=113505 RepID=UPI00391F373D